MSIISTLSSCSKQDRIKALELLMNHPDTKPLFDAMATEIVKEVLTTSCGVDL